MVVGKHSKKNSVIPFTPITPQQQSQIGWSLHEPSDGAREWQILANEIYTKRQQRGNQATRTTRRKDWYQDRYSHDSDFFNHDFVPTLGDRDYRSDGTISWY